MKKIIVSDKCNACGMCMEISDLVVSNERGFAQAVNGGFFQENEENKVKEMIEICPVSAIFVEEESTVEGGKAGLLSLRDTLKKKLEAVVKPQITIEDIKFDATSYDVDLGNYYYMSGYEYTSSSAAERAALQVFDKVAYSQYRKIILSIFVQYKNDKLKPFYTFDENSFYAKNNITYQKILGEILSQTKIVSNNNIKLNEDFLKFDVFPGDDFDSLPREDVVYGLASFEEQSTRSGIMEEFRSGSYSSLDSYNMYIDTDDLEVYAGENWRGEPKYKEMYRYTDVHKAVKEFIKDLKRAMNYVDIDKSAMYFLENALKSYYDSVDLTIKRKIEEFDKAIKEVK